MIVYNVTVNVENDIREEWLKWMKEIHIPDVMKTGCFFESKIFKILVNEESGTSFSIQYSCHTMQQYEKYKAEFAPKLQQDVKIKFADKFVAFRTLLETA